jgi:two-component sensor histidine kinase
MDHTRITAMPDAPPPVVEEPPVGAQESKATKALDLRIRQQEILAELGVLSLRGTPFSELLDAAVRLTANGLEAEYSKVLEHKPDEGNLLVVAGVGWDEGVIGKATLGADLESPSGFALQTGTPVVSNQLENEERFRTPDLLVRHGIRRAINVILQGDGAPFGVLEVDSTSAGDFSEKDIAFLQGAANIIGLAIERQRYDRDLRAALEHQQVLLKEINHRVKNSLQLVTSMLSLRANSQSDPGVHQVLTEASARVSAISRAHDRLYRSADVTRIEIAAYLAEVCNDLTQAIHHCEVAFASDGPVFMSTDRAINLALLVTELVTNAAKHAYGDEGGQVNVHLTSLANETISIVVKDHGVGLPEGFRPQDSQGLGMRLVTALTRQMHASLEIPKREKGAWFVLRVPLAEPSATA